MRYLEMGKLVVKRVSVGWMNVGAKHTHEPQFPLRLPNPAIVNT